MRHALSNVSTRRDTIDIASEYRATHSIARSNRLIDALKRSPDRYIRHSLFAIHMYTRFPSDVKIREKLRYHRHTWWTRPVTRNITGQVESSVSINASRRSIDASLNAPRCFGRALGIYTDKRVWRETRVSENRSLRRTIERDVIGYESREARSRSCRVNNTTINTFGRSIVVRSGIPDTVCTRNSHGIDKQIREKTKRSGLDIY